MITFTIDTFSELNREDGRIHPAVAVRLNSWRRSSFLPLIRPLNGQSMETRRHDRPLADGHAVRPGEKVSAPVPLVMPCSTR